MSTDCSLIMVFVITQGEVSATLASGAGGGHPETVTAIMSGAAAYDSIILS